MRKYLILIAALGALMALTVGSLASADTVKSGNLEFTLDGGFSPKTLPKKTYAPITLSTSGKIKTLDGSHPPALKEVLGEVDKNGVVDVKGYPVCKAGKLQAQDTAHARKACAGTEIGRGHTNVEILFEESKPVPVSSELSVFNGGVKGGVTTFYIHAYITFPVPAAIVTTVKIKKTHKGPYGYSFVASIPKIAGGSGSVTSFELKIHKIFTYKGKKVSVLSAKCPTGKLQAHGTAVFSDGTRLSTGIVKPCTGRG
jgi:hypothetical protein